MTPKDICLRCGGKVSFLRREKIQLGKQGWFLGNLPHLFAGAMTLNIYVCEDCLRCEFYLDEEDLSSSEEDSVIAQITCRVCGTRYDIDYPQCPHCHTKTEF